MKLFHSAMATGGGQMRRGLVMLAAGSLGLALGNWLTGPEWEAVERLDAEVAPLQARLQSAAATPHASTPAAPAVPQWPAADDLPMVWTGLQQRLQAHGLQLLSMRPQAISVVKDLPEQTVLLSLQGRWDDWLMLERAFGAHVPWWGVEQWQVVPAGLPAAQVRIELQARLGLLPPALQEGTSRAWAWPTWAVDLAPGGRSVPLWGVPTTSLADRAEPGAGSALAGGPASPWPADPRRWPVSEWHLLGVWQQSGVAHAVLGAGLDSVVLRPGQRLGRDGWRVHRVGHDRVELVAAGGAQVLHLTLGGDPP